MPGLLTEDDVLVVTLMALALLSDLVALPTLFDVVDDDDDEEDTTAT